jgi:hypothetical protein
MNEQPVRFEAIRRGLGKILSGLLNQAAEVADWHFTFVFQSLH